MIQFGRDEVFRIMKAWLKAVLLVAIFSLSGWSVESPVMRNPAGYGTIPPSSYRNGLVNNPNPIDATGNLLMTGNVRRGMHFRGAIPYRSTTSFSATLGSSALNSFLRDTAGSEDFGSRSNKYRVQPFYSPAQMVTTMVPGRSEVFHPMGMKMDDRIRPGTTFVGNGLLGLDAMPRAHTSHDQEATADDSDFQKLQERYRPLVEPPSTSEGTSRRGVSLGSRHMEHLVPGQLGIRQNQEGEVRGRTTEDRRQEEKNRKPMSGLDPQLSDPDLTQNPGEDMSLEDLKSRLELLHPVGSAEVKTVKDEFTAHSGLVAVDQADPWMSPTQVKDPKPKTQDPSSESGVGRLEYGDRREVLEQISKQLDALTKSVEAGLLDTRRESPLPNRESRVENPDFSEPSLETRYQIVDARRELPNQNQESRIEDLESVESFSQSRFNQHVSAAEDHLKAGRYYRAVDSFTLAAVYEPSNPVVLAGKGHALFAAGEYMSSALFLARVLAVQPDYTQVKIDLAAMLGGPEKLAERIAEVEQWLARSGSAQLQFLLSYAYFRAGRLNQAKQAINKAFEKMPHSPAVVAMRTAIHQATR